MQDSPQPPPFDTCPTPETLALTSGGVGEMDQAKTGADTRGAEDSVRAENDPDFPKIPGYRIVGLLDSDGMGPVYDAIHLRLHRHVAIKVVAETTKSEPELASRFAQEMALIGQLNHPGIVRTYDAAEIAGMHYLVMEHVTGRTVSEILGNRRHLSVSDSCEIVRQVAKALQHIHENGLSHGEIKPSNVMIHQSGVVKVLNLGIADSQATDIRSDLYSLGKMFYGLLTGDLTCDPGDNDEAMAELHARTSPTNRFVLRRDHVPIEVIAACEKLLSIDPQQPFQQPKDLAVVLKPFCEGADLGLLAGGDVNRITGTMDARSMRRDRQSGAKGTHGYKRLKYAACIAMTTFLLFGCLMLIPRTDVATETSAGTTEQPTTASDATDTAPPVYTVSGTAQGSLPLGFSALFFDEDSDLIVTGGDVFAAINAGASGADHQIPDHSYDEVTVNGLLHSASNKGIESFQFAGPFADGEFGSLSLDAEKLTNQIAGCASPVKLRVPGLTVGRRYLLQIYYATENRGRVIELTAEGESSGTLFTTNLYETPRIITYHWIAEDTTLEAALSSTGFERNAFLSGYSVQQVP